MRDTNGRRVIPIMANRHQSTGVLRVPRTGPDPRHGRSAPQRVPPPAGPRLDHDIVEGESPVRVRLDGGLLGGEPRKQTPSVPFALDWSWRNWAQCQNVPSCHKRSRLPQVGASDAAAVSVAVVPFQTRRRPFQPRVMAGYFLGGKDAVDEARAARAA